MMKIKLPYSPQEQRALAALEREPLSTIEITNKAYSAEFQKRFGKKTRPRFARTSMVSTLDHLMQKVKVNGESYRICKSDRNGPNPINYWIEDKAVRPSNRGIESKSVVA